ncbi:Oidioi.mRNA.OKI2018_I69.PAR.g11760.t1.cds [Oikopleura dioica]|uniref:Oidioi.mRNA.OKI2018_I69.PAR.g11760.t1.cds n=1 Tax=Oikopleura dioica TaxID=34765 RepID=A0ABN7S2V4_OIKDI|nr:Oidioi.mRNA.OKI2018_I69.PAR.g11760.t1.cds [Oikopleura dioica]
MGHYIKNDGYIEFAERELREKNRKTVAFYRGVDPVIWTVDTEIINDVFVKHFSSFTSRLKPTGSMGQGKDIREALNVITDPHQWRRVRQTISPSFSNRQLTEMLEIIKDRLDILEEQIDGLEGEATDVGTIAGKFTMDGTLSAAMGIDMNEDLKDLKDFENHPAVRHFYNLMNPGPSMFFYVMIPGLGLLADEQLLIDKKSAKNAQRGLTETEIISQIFVIFVAGYETTKTLLQTAFYHLAKDQKLQQEVLKEVRGLDEHYDNLNPKKMPLTCAVLHECLRLFPPVGIHLRWCEADTMVNGIPMTRGASIEVPVDLLHTMEEYWGEDAHEFNPYRFIEDPELEKAPFFLPFGAGPRNCIGLRFANIEARLAIQRLVSNYEVSLPEGFVPDIKLIRLPSFFMDFSKEIKLHFKRR